MKTSTSALKLRTLASALALVTAVFLSATAHAAEVEIIPDVVYGHKDGLAMTFDVIKPKINANGAAILFMVSGGWVSTWVPPAQIATRYQELLDKGFTVIAVRHGSSPKYSFRKSSKTCDERCALSITTRSSGALILNVSECMVEVLAAIFL